MNDLNTAEGIVVSVAGGLLIWALLALALVI